LILEITMICDGMMQNPVMMLAMGVVWIGLLGLMMLGIFALKS
jgi:hypothetical protein